MDGSIKELFLLVKGYYTLDIMHRKTGLAMWLGKECDSVAALLIDQLTFWSSHPSRKHF